MIPYVLKSNIEKLIQSYGENIDIPSSRTELFHYIWKNLTKEGK